MDATKLAHHANYPPIKPIEPMEHYPIWRVSENSRAVDITTKGNKPQ